MTAANVVGIVWVDFVSKELQLGFSMCFQMLGACMNYCGIAVRRGAKSLFTKEWLCSNGGKVMML